MHANTSPNIIDLLSISWTSLFWYIISSGPNNFKRSKSSAYSLHESFVFSFIKSLYKGLTLPSYLSNSICSDALKKKCFKIDSLMVTQLLCKFSLITDFFLQHMPFKLLAVVTLKIMVFKRNRTRKYFDILKLSNGKFEKNVLLDFLTNIFFKNCHLLLKK